MVTSIGRIHKFVKEKEDPKKVINPTIKKLIRLLDTPDSYDGQAGKILSINAIEDGIEFVDPGSIGDYIPLSQKGSANGVAPLNAFIKIDHVYLNYDAGTW